MTKPGRTHAVQNSRRHRLAKRNPAKAIKEHKVRAKRRHQPHKKET